MDNISIIASIIAATTLSTSPNISPKQITNDSSINPNITVVEENATKAYNQDNKYQFVTDQEIENCNK